jgi:hypothetical protein
VSDIYLRENGRGEPVEASRVNVERSKMLVLGGTPRFRVLEEIASSTLTVRLSAWGEVAVLVRNPTGIAKITGLTPPSGF